MKAIQKPYNHARDNLRVRQFIIDTFGLYGGPYNWMIERWNFCPNFVLPIHTYYNTRYFGVPTRPHRSFRDEFPYWEAGNAIWEDEQGEVVALVTSENEEPGEAWLQIHPSWHHLYGEMLDYAEEKLADRVDGIAYNKIFVPDGSLLERLVNERGYRQLPYRHAFSVAIVRPVPSPELPDGYVIKTVCDEDDVDRRRIAKAVAFGGNYAPSSWTPADVFRKMQNAPDYRPELDLFIVAPNGDYASFCTIWVDEANLYANFEPVGTRVEYQGMGLGKALLQEGFRRMAALGMRKSYMDSGNQFYAKAGFAPMDSAYHAWIRHVS